MSTANTNDNFLHVPADWTGAVGSGGVSDGTVTTIPLVSSTNLPTDTAIEITIDRVDSGGTPTPSKKEVIKGIVSSTNLISCLRGVEGTAQAHSAGAIIEVMLTADMWNSIISAMLTGHTQSGQHNLTNIDGIHYASDSGTANAYAITLSPVPSGYFNGMAIRFIAVNANTTISTINVNGLGAKTIKKSYNTDLAANDIIVGQLVELVYDGTNFQIGTPNLSSFLTSASPISQRINPRTNTVDSSATPAINTDTTDIFTITALATAITSMTASLTGTPVNGQKLIIRIKDDGTARAIAWGASFASRGATLPTTTVLGKYLYVGLIYNSTAIIWDCIAVSLEA